MASCSDHPAQVPALVLLVCPGSQVTKLTRNPAASETANSERATAQANGRVQLEKVEDKVVSARLPPGELQELCSSAKN